MRARSSRASSGPRRAARPVPRITDPQAVTRTRGAPGSGGIRTSPAHRRPSVGARPAPSRSFAAEPPGIAVTVLVPATRGRSSAAWCRFLEGAGEKTARQATLQWSRLPRFQGGGAEGGSNLRGRGSAASRRRQSSSPPTPAILTPRDTRNHESPAEDPRILNPRRSLRHLRQTGRITWSIAGLEKDTGPALAAARWARTSRRTSCQAPPGRPRLVLAASCTGETPRPHQSTGTRARRWPESARAFRH
jgi:hypothetical protein